MTTTDPSQLKLADDDQPVLKGLLGALKGLLGSESAESAINCHELGDFLAARGQTQGAGLLYERALAIKRRLLGEDHPEVAATLHNLALLRQAEGRVEEADRLWAQARAAFKPPPEGTDQPDSDVTH